MKKYNSNEKLKNCIHCAQLSQNQIHNWIHLKCSTVQCLILFVSNVSNYLYYKTIFEL